MRLKALLLLCAGALSAHAGLIDDFRFQGNLNDSLSAATLTGLGGTTTATSYNFAANQGLSLSNPGITGTYTIAFLASLTDTGGYRRLVDFQNLTSDTGLYNLNGNLDFFNITNGSGSPITANTPFTVAITRDATTNTFVGYVNGTSAFSFVDSTSLGVFSSNIAYFFRDDNAVPGEASGGSVSRIEIWNNALNADQVGALRLGSSPTTTPEPSTFVLMLSGVAWIVSRKRWA
jgi:hypothetical protein